jgi:hypothetical protein
MKTSLLFFIVAIIVFTGCKKEEKTVKEVPNEIIRVETCATLYDRINEITPETKAIEKKFPFLLSDTVQKKIILTRESEVFCTFIAESAALKNTFGWYSYTEGNAPKSLNEANLHLIFPNVSEKGEGGELEKGDMMQLGEKAFPKGTVIGFFLIMSGWQNGVINYAGKTFYTDFALNENGSQQHVLYKEKGCGDLVLGFEDLALSIPAVDKDYNDIVVTISDNKAGYESISFDTAKVPSL